MKRHHAVATIAALSVFATGCASTTGGSPEVVRGPTELGCAYAEPTDPTVATARVTLRFDVLPDGSVEPGSVHRVGGHHDTDREDLIREAEQAALTCAFRPAVARDGRPVETTITKRFAFNPRP